MNDPIKRILGVFIVLLLLCTLGYYGIKILREKNTKEEVQKLESLFTQIGSAMQNRQPPETFAPSVEEIEKIVNGSKSPLLKYANLPKLAELHLLFRQPDKARAAAAEAQALLPKCLRMTRKDNEKLNIIILLVPAVRTFHILGDEEEAAKVRDEMTVAARELSPWSQIVFMSHMMAGYAELVPPGSHPELAAPAHYFANIALGYAAQIEERLGKMDEATYPQKSGMLEATEVSRKNLEKIKADYAQAVEKAAAAEAKKAGDAEAPEAGESDADAEKTPEKPGLNFSVDDI